MLGWIRKR